jgi:hypothetical protein
MLVILNSDVLYTNYFVHERLHKQWNAFVEGCRSIGAELVFPQTALYEIELRQRELYEAEVAAIEDAARTLHKYGAGSSIRGEDLIKVPNIVELFRSAGATVHVETATLEDFQDAEKRAALHLSPAPSRRLSPSNEVEETSDEMRDLVIWAMACRLAKDKGNALLLSRDKVHSGDSGKEEAAQCGLLRAKDFADALGMMGAETEPGKIARGFLVEAWPQLLASGIPISEAPKIQTISNVIFTQGESGIASAEFYFGCDSAKGKRFSAKVEINDIQPKYFEVALSDMKIEKNNCGSDPNPLRITRDVGPERDDSNERLNELKAVLEQKWT